MDVLLHGHYFDWSNCCSLNSWWQGDELEYGITNSESKLFIGDEERLDRLGDRCSDVAKISVRSNNPDHQEFDFYKVIEGASDKLENPVEILPETMLP